MLISSALLGIGNRPWRTRRSANLIVGAVDSTQTGVASGMNTVMRTLGGALGGQISATFVVNSTHHGPGRSEWLHGDVHHVHRVHDRLPGRPRPSSPGARRRRAAFATGAAPPLARVSGAG